MSLEKQQFCILMESTSSVFPMADHAFGAQSKNFLPDPWLPRSSVLSCGGFTVLSFIFRSMISFELMVFGITFSLHVDVQLF